MTSKHARIALAGVAVVVAYVATARLGLSYGQYNQNITVFWPPAGVGVAAIVLGGVRFAPAVLVGSLLADAIGTTPLGVSALVAGGNTAGALLGAALLGTWRFDPALRRLRDVGALIVAAALTALAAALIGVSAFVVGGAVAGDTLAAFRYWWVGDSFGVLIVTPLITAWWTGGRRVLKAPRPAIVGAVVVAGCSTAAYTTFYLSAPPGSWSVLASVAIGAIWMRQLGTTVAVATVAVIAVSAQAAGRTTFADAPDTALFALVEFVVATAIAAFVLAAVTSERAAANRRLRRAAADLEMTIEQRTRDLSMAVHELGAREQHLSAVMEQLPVQTWVVGRDLHFVSLTGSWEPDGVREPQRLVGQPIRDGFSLSDDDPALDAIDRALRGESVSYASHRRSMSYSNFVVPLYDEDEVIGAIGVAIDVTEQQRTLDALSESERRLRQIIDITPEAFVAMDLAGRISDWSPSAERLFGWQRDEVIGREMADTILPGRFQDSHRERLARYLATGEQAILGGRELTAVRRDGTEVPIALSIRSATGDDERAFFAFISDETSRRDAELVRSRLAVIVTSSDDAIYSEDLHGMIETWNGGAERLYGYSAAEAIGNNVSMIVPEAREGEDQRIVDRVLAEGAAVSHHETTRRCKEGQEVEVTLTTSAIRDEAGQVVGVSVVARDVSERNRAQAELERTYELARRGDNERRRLLSHLVAAQERERQVIAEDIHDDSIQVMVAVGMRLGMIRQKLTDANGIDKAIESITKVEDLVRLTTLRLRRLLFQLQPPALFRAGLGEGIREFLEQSLAVEEGLKFSVDDRLTKQPPSETRVLAFRIAQEAIANARKHAHATRLRVVIEGTVDDGFTLTIADDGLGFVPAEQVPQPGHLGMTSMRERAETAGGWLRVVSTPGKGTTVTAHVPAHVRVGSGEVETSDVGTEVVPR